MPDVPLSYWKAYGWSPFANGLIWLTNPEDYENIVQEWLGEISEFKGLKWYVFARTAFGSIYAFQPESAQIIDILCVKGTIVGSKEVMPINKESEIQTFFLVVKKEHLILKMIMVIHYLIKHLKNLEDLKQMKYMVFNHF